MMTKIESFSCDTASHKMLNALHKRLAAQGPGVPISRSFVIRWAISKASECTLRPSEFRTLSKKINR